MAASVVFVVRGEPDGGIRQHVRDEGTRGQRLMEIRSFLLPAGVTTNLSVTAGQSIGLRRSLIRPEDHVPEDRRPERATAMYSYVFI